MSKKIKVGIIFGGKSAEHEVSLQSAKNVVEALDKEKYEPVLIGVDKSGKWLLADNFGFLLSGGGNSPVAIVPQSGGKISNLENSAAENAVDVVFPVLHGPFGEDGTVQGLLKLANVPFVGPGVLGSAVGMDKDVMKRLLRDAGLPIAKFVAAKKSEMPDYQDLIEEIGLPFFIKPANLGSSVGVNKVKGEADFKKAIEEAFKYDNKIIIEEYIDGREIECAVLGNDDPKSSVPGEIIPTHEFYSYEAKYLDENGARMEIPAKLDNDTAERIRELAVETFKILCCEGMGRVDFFLKKNGEVIVNEINTIPGFTSISMYPKLWEASGIAYKDLIDRLIQLALERFESERKLMTSR